MFAPTNRLPLTGRCPDGAEGYNSEFLITNSELDGRPVAVPTVPRDPVDRPGDSLSQTVKKSLDIGEKMVYNNICIIC